MRRAALFIVFSIVIASLPAATSEAFVEGGAGVGIAIARSGEDVIVEKLKNGMSADRAGVVEGDVIITIDGVFVKGKPLDQVENLLNGRAGIEVVLTVRSNGGTERTYPLIRELLIEPTELGLPIIFAPKEGWYARSFV
jgi:C-terminal processing protease CtpA/Prc